MEKNEDSQTELMRETLRDLLHKGIVTVVFTKKSGAEREMICSLADRFLRDVPTSEGKKTRATNPDTCVVYDLEREDWRSFRYDSVLYFKNADAFYEMDTEMVSQTRFITIPRNQ